MAIDKTMISKEEARLIELVGMAEKRVRRAREKAASALAEQEAAQRAMGAAHASLDDWRDAQPHQRNLPL